MCGVLARIVVTCTGILPSERSTMGHPFGFIANGTLSYRFNRVNTIKARSFGTMLNPDHLRRKDSR